MVQKYIIEINDSKIEEFKIGFLKQNPVPVSEETGLQEFTDDDWITESLIRWSTGVYKRGKMKIAQEGGLSIEEGIIS